MAWFCLLIFIPTSILRACYGEVSHVLSMQMSMHDDSKHQSPDIALEAGSRPALKRTNSGIVRASVDIQSRTSAELERRKSFSQNVGSNQNAPMDASAPSDVFANHERKKERLL